MIDRLELVHVGDHGRIAPDLVIQPTIDFRRQLSAHDFNTFASAGSAGWQIGSAGSRLRKHDMNRKQDQQQKWDKA